MSILVVAEHDNNEIKGSTLNTVTAASEIGGEQLNMLLSVGRISRRLCWYVQQSMSLAHTGYPG